MDITPIAQAAIKYSAPKYEKVSFEFDDKSLTEEEKQEVIDKFNSYRSNGMMNIGSINLDPNHTHSHHIENDGIIEEHNEHIVAYDYANNQQRGGKTQNNDMILGTDRIYSEQYTMEDYNITGSIYHGNTDLYFTINNIHGTYHKEWQGSFFGSTDTYIDRDMKGILYI